MLADGGWARRTWRKDHCLAACLLGARPVLTHGVLCSLNPGQSYWHPTPSLPRWPPGCPLDLIYLLAHPLGPSSQLTSRDHHTPIHPGQAACSQVFMKDRRQNMTIRRERREVAGRGKKNKHGRRGTAAWRLQLKPDWGFRRRGESEWCWEKGSWDVSGTGSWIPVAMKVQPQLLLPSNLLLNRCPLGGCLFKFFPHPGTLAHKSNLERAGWLLPPALSTPKKLHSFGGFLAPLSVHLALATASPQATHQGQSREVTRSELGWLPRVWFWPRTQPGWVGCPYMYAWCAGVHTGKWRCCTYSFGQKGLGFTDQELRRLLAEGGPKT